MAQRVMRSMNKFGQNAAVGTTFETIMDLPGTEIHETYVTTNAIDTISSAAAGDTGITFDVSGMTISSGVLTSVNQTVTTDGSNGQTEVTLDTPLARINRAYVSNSGTPGSPQSLPAGNIYFHEGGSTAGVPDTDSTVHAMILAGSTQTDKCATSTDSDEYLFISYLIAGIGTAGGSANRVVVRLERRDVANGGIWRPLGGDVAFHIDSASPPARFDPYLIVPSNHDIRVVARTNANTAAVFAEFGGFFGEGQLPS